MKNLSRFVEHPTSKDNTKINLTRAPRHLKFHILKTDDFSPNLRISIQRGERKRSGNPFRFFPSEEKKTVSIRMEFTYP